MRCRENLEKRAASLIWTSDRGFAWDNTIRDFFFLPGAAVAASNLACGCFLKKWTIFNGWTKWKSWKFSLLRNARIRGSRHRAGDRCDAMPWRQQPRTAQARCSNVTSACRRPAAISPNVPDFPGLSLSWILVQAKIVWAVQLAHLPRPPLFFFDSRPPV